VNPKESGSARRQSAGIEAVILINSIQESTSAIGIDGPETLRLNSNGEIFIGTLHWQ
jgi:hypothetical protein